MTIIHRGGRAPHGLAQLAVDVRDGQAGPAGRAAATVAATP